MMHPDEIEEMDYQANAHYDYLRETFGPTADDAARMCEEDAHWDYERDCDVRTIPTVCEARHDSHCRSCVSAFCSFFDIDNIPF